MEQTALKSFAYRISQATRGEMVVIMYDVILRDIQDAKSAYDSMDLDEYEKSLKHAQRFINELMGTLDFNYDISIDLRCLYIYAEREIIAAQFKHDAERLEGAIVVIEGLRSAFATISKSDASEPVMTNSQQMYAGLTYGKGTLNETDMLVSGASRGYLV